VLEIENITIAYGDRVVLSDFFMQLSRGESVCISGESGCGKSSLLNAIMGFTDIRSGRICVGGVEMNRTNVDAVRRQIAWIPQELALPVEWVSEMVKMPFELKANRQADFSEERLMECFDQLGLEHEVYRKRVNEISGGQRQRVMIAVAALLRKPLIIVDEPTSALDHDSSLRVLSFLNRLADNGAAVVAVSHDRNFQEGMKYNIKFKGESRESKV
jgi:putative ABC transport system ATP-binding protein